MGLFVFCLVTLPVLALTAFPVTTRRLAHRGVAPASRETVSIPPAAAKGIDSIRWMRSAEEHIRCLKSVA